MNSIFGIGPLEFVLILIIALLIFNPKDIAKTSQTVGRWLRTVVKSDVWRTVRNTANELRNIPTRIMRESGLEDSNKDILPSETEIRQAFQLDDLSKDPRQLTSELSAWTTPGKTAPPTGTPPPANPASSHDDCEARALSDPTKSRGGR